MAGGICEDRTRDGLGHLKISPQGDKPTGVAVDQQSVDEIGAGIHNSVKEYTRKVTSRAFGHSVSRYGLLGVRKTASSKTKRQLNVIFSLGLVTAFYNHSIPSLLAYSSIGNMVPSYYFTVFEDKLGIIFACAPAIRQCGAYRSPTHTFLPSKQQQYPSEDFEKMRYRISLRDIFWYRKARTVGDRVQ